MIGLPATIYLALEPVDFRKLFDGLSVEIVEGLGCGSHAAADEPESDRLLDCGFPID